jgi:membrane-bound lytic murein transglycosylase D
MEGGSAGPAVSAAFPRGSWRRPARGPHLSFFARVVQTFATFSRGGGIGSSCPGPGEISAGVDSWVTSGVIPQVHGSGHRYLKNSCDFGDWSLALPLQCGEGAIGRALKEEGCEDYYSLCEASDDLKMRRCLRPQVLPWSRSAGIWKKWFDPSIWRSAPGARVLKAKPHRISWRAQSVGLGWKEFREFNPNCAAGGRARWGRRAGASRGQGRRFGSVRWRPNGRNSLPQGQARGYLWACPENTNVSVKDLQNANKVKKLHVGQVLRIPGDFCQEASASTGLWSGVKRGQLLVLQGDRCGQSPGSSKRIPRP